MNFVLNSVLRIYLEVLSVSLSSFFVLNFDHVDTFWQTIGIKLVIKVTVLVNDDVILVNRSLVAVRVANSDLDVTVWSELVTNYGNLVPFSNAVRQHVHDRMFRVIRRVVISVI